MKALEIYAGAQAREHLAINGFNAMDVFAVPGAAGGPKGLILQGLDQFLFGSLFDQRHLEQRTTPLQLIGASIGAWRMAAACSRTPEKALQELANQYCEAQRYRKGVSATEITSTCKQMISAFVAQSHDIISKSHNKQLLVWINKGKRPLFQTKSLKAKKRGFAFATLANSISREKLNHYLERWVFTSGEPPRWLKEPFDGMDCHFESLTPDNLQTVLLGSASIPFILEPVPSISASHGAPVQGPFWDGGLTDYHLALPYHRKKGLVLYPHFSSQITPGWLDKFINLRKANPTWMSNVILICPSQEFVSSLPAQKIPDRQDFKIHGANHDTRIKLWKQAIAESERLAEEFSTWLGSMDLGQVKSI